MKILIADDDPVTCCRLEHSLTQWGHEVVAVGDGTSACGLLPICCYCKKIRNDENYWQQVEAYITSHSEAEFSHTICPKCYDENIRPELDRLRTAPAPTGRVTR